MKKFNQMPDYQKKKSLPLKYRFNRKSPFAIESEGEEEELYEDLELIFENQKKQLETPNFVRKQT